MAKLDQPTFREALRVAMARADIRSMVKLSECSGVSRNTLYSWGVTAPKYGELSKVAGALDVPMAYLVDALEGRLWPDPQTREVHVSDGGVAEETVERVVRLTLERIAAEGHTPKGRGTGRAR